MGKDSRERWELQGENLNLSRISMSHFRPSGKPSRTRRSRPCRVAPIPLTWCSVNPTFRNSGTVGNLTWACTSLPFGTFDRYVFDPWQSDPTTPESLIIERTIFLYHANQLLRLHNRTQTPRLLMKPQPEIKKVSTLAFIYFWGILHSNRAMPFRMNHSGRSSAYRGQRRSTRFWPEGESWSRQHHRRKLFMLESRFRKLLLQPGRVLVTD